MEELRKQLVGVGFLAIPQTIYGGHDFGRVTDTQMDRDVSVYERCIIGAPILYVVGPGKIIPLHIITTFKVLLHRTSVKGGAYTLCIDA